MLAYKRFKWHFKLYIMLFLLLSATLATWKFKQNLWEAWMRYDIRNEYVVISLTTTPHRIYAIQPIIDFILAEKLPIKTIYLNVPYVFKRDNTPYVIPDFLTNNKNITIIRTDDYGPGTKLLGTLAHADLPKNAILITLDDDIKYPQNLLLYLTYNAKYSPGYAVGFSGMNPHYNKRGKILVDMPYGVGLTPVKSDQALVSILEGFAGIAYRPFFFDSSIFSISDAPRECRNSDDVYISFHLAKNGVPRKVIRKKAMSLQQIQWNIEVGFQKDALHQLSPRPAVRHRTCIEYLQAQYPGVNF